MDGVTTTICKNCNHQFEGNFCNHCGQAANTHRLSLHDIWHDLQHGLFHVDTGFFYTINQLLIRPGHTIRDFINGKRVRLFKPLAFIVVLATLQGLLYHVLFSDLSYVQPIHPREDLLSIYDKIIRWNLDHFAYAALFLTITTTLASYGVFKKQGYNVAEHLVLNTYYRGLELVLSLLIIPLLFIFLKDVPEGLKNLGLLSQLLSFILMYWCYAQFFNKLSKIKVLGLTMLTYFLMSAINLMVGYLVGLLINVFF